MKGIVVLKKIRDFFVMRRYPSIKSEADDIVALLRNPNVVLRQERRNQIADLIEMYQKEIEKQVDVYEVDLTHGNL